MVLRDKFQTMPAMNYVLALSWIEFRNCLIGASLGFPILIAPFCLFFDLLVAKFHAGQWSSPADYSVDDIVSGSVRFVQSMK